MVDGDGTAADEQVAAAARDEDAETQLVPLALWKPHEGRPRPRRVVDVDVVAHPRDGIRVFAVPREVLRSLVVQPEDAPRFAHADLRADGFLLEFRQ